MAVEAYLVKDRWPAGSEDDVAQLIHQSDDELVPDYVCKNLVRFPLRLLLASSSFRHGHARCGRWRELTFCNVQQHTAVLADELEQLVVKADQLAGTFDLIRRDGLDRVERGPRFLHDWGGGVPGRLERRLWCGSRAEHVPVNCSLGKGPDERLADDVLCVGDELERGVGPQKGREFEAVDRAGRERRFEQLAEVELQR